MNTVFFPEVEIGNPIEFDVMGFLNEIQNKYPDAMSLASGRPDSRFFEFEKIANYIDIYFKHLINQKICADLNELGQYNKAKGIINDLVARFLQNEYQMKVDPANIIISVGTQESILITLMALCNRKEDVIIVENPSYIGLSHCAKLLALQLEAVEVASDGLCLESLERKIKEVKAFGRKVKLIYVTPDFQNPTGNSMSYENRIALLKMANQHDFFILEDNAYGDFLIEGDRLDTLKKLDTQARVIYMHSFSKVIFPGLRIGILITDWILKDGTALIDSFAKVKGYVTVNTPSITQAVFAGILIKNNYSLKSLLIDKVNDLTIRRNSILNALNKYFVLNNEIWSKHITWNIPKGGFFLTIRLPFTISNEDVEQCAKEYKVIFTPMSFFYLTKGGESEIRLAYSNLPQERFDSAINKLSQFLKNKYI